MTPIAVTSAPAPAPWMIRGRGEYLFVSLMIPLVHMSDVNDKMEEETRGIPSSVE